MMASNLLSRLLPSASDEAGAHPPHARSASTASDDQHDVDIDEQNLGARFEDQDLENLLADASSSHMTTESTAFLSGARRPPPPPGQARRPAPVYDDDDVPGSLLLEGTRSPVFTRSGQRHAPQDRLPPPVPGPSTGQTRAQWDTTRRYQRLHDEEQGPAAVPRWGILGREQISADPRQRALWRWVNVTDLDAFLEDVYDYYTGCGKNSIILRGVLRLLQSVFVVIFITFLTWCVDYSRLSQSHRMSDVIVPKCAKKIHGFWLFALWIFSIYSLNSCVQLVLRLGKLSQMHDFFHHLLDIPDRDIVTVEWQHVVNRIMALRDQNLTTASNLSPQVRKLLDHQGRQRLDAVDIANRIMRQDNFLIALFNREILDVTVPIPFLGNRYIFSETTHFHVGVAILDFVFSGPGKTFNRDFLKVNKRRELIEKLQVRLFWVGVFSFLYAPFNATFILVSYVFKYFTEYHKDPSQLSSRDFTPFAQWRFREFNELPHLFNRRKNMAYPYANLYLSQFPSDKTEQIAAFVAFVAGAFAFVLFSITLLDSELFLNFEITPGKTALFWIGVFSAIYRVARSTSPREMHVPDPEYYLKHVIYHTRYEPSSWKDKLHTDEVRAEFATLYQNKLLIFAEEIFSMLITPFLLISRFQASSDRIVDFFREFSIVVDGLGVVCSFSMFPFQKGVGDAGPARERTRGRIVGGRSTEPDDQDLREDYFKTKDEKMLNSYYGFLDTYAMNGRLQNRGSFIPPPQFNHFGAMSQTGHAGEMSMRATGRGPRAPPGPSRTPRHGPTMGRDEPMNSMLLDPHHQPSASVLRKSPRQPPHGRFPSAPSEVIEEESLLEDSWRLSGPNQDSEGSEEEPAAGAKGGVLQLLHQFSKAQAEGRGLAGGI